jgi:ketosteroid isomerase-like protein
MGSWSLKASEAALIAALAATVATPAFAADPAPVIAAERAFAADGLTLGFKTSFLKHSAPDAIVMQPGPVNAHASLKAAPDKGGPALYWWPVWAGLSRSRDLGFTTGPYTLSGKHGGYYFTVWKKQPDGRWKWIYDGGAGGSGPHVPPPPASQPRALADAPAAAGSAAAAMKEVGAAEATLAKAAEKDLKAAYLAVLADDARIQGSPAPPADTAPERERELSTRPAAASFKALGGEAARAGDLAWTYGEAQWSKEGAAAKGHYVRIWRKGQAGWRIVYDQLQAVPPPKPASA